MPQANPMLKYSSKCGTCWPILLFEKKWGFLAQPLTTLERGKKGLLAIYLLLEEGGLVGCLVTRGRGLVGHLLTAWTGACWPSTYYLRKGGLLAVYLLLEEGGLAGRLLTTWGRGACWPSTYYLRKGGLLAIYLLLEEGCLLGLFLLLEKGGGCCIVRACIGLALYLPQYSHLILQI